MYLVRPALRASTGRPPARFIRGRRYPSPTRFRTFHATRQLAQASNPPSAPGSTPPDHNDAKKTDGERATEQQAEAAMANEDPDVLLQRLQRARETTRRYSAALRRQQRGKRAQGLPPVHIPDWFLKRRVIRREDQLQDRHHESRRLPLLSVTLGHKDSGEHATCSIPAGIELDAPLVVSRFTRALWNQRLDLSEKIKVESYLSERTELPEKDASARAHTKEGDIGAETEDAKTATTGDGQSSPESKSIRAEDAALLSAMRDLGHIIHDSKMEPLAKLEAVMKSEAMMKQNTKFGKASMRRAVAKARDIGRPKQLSPLVAAEIRATIAASLNAIQPAIGDSFPSTKTNVILHAPTPEQEGAVDQCVLANAFEFGSDVILLQAMDLAQLAGDYLGEGTEPSPRSVRSLGYETYRLNSELKSVVQDMEESAEDEQEFTSSPVGGASMSPRIYTIPFSNIKTIMQSIGNMGSIASSAVANDESGRSQNQNELQLEDIKIASLLEALIDANETKENRGLIGGAVYQPSHTPSQSGKPLKAPAFFDYSMDPEGVELELNSSLPDTAKDTMTFALTTGSAKALPELDSSKIIYVKDFKELNATHYGGRILQKLEEIVRKRRASGEKIMIIGSTCSRDLTPEVSDSGVRGLQSEGESSAFRCIVVTPEASSSSSAPEESVAVNSRSVPALPPPLEMSKSQRINALHIQHMLRSLDPVAADTISDMNNSPHVFHSWAPIISTASFQRVLTYDEVHRIALTALGLVDRRRSTTSDNVSNQINWAHVALAIGLLEASDASKYIFFETLRTQKNSRNLGTAKDLTAQMGGQPGKTFDEADLKRQRQLALIAATATKYEKRLMPGIADPNQIKTTFDQVHVPKETIDSLRTITSLSLLRPEAFSYGILASEKISGALLYGPPGTGKTLLAKAVAKESGSTVLEVSGSQIMDKYVGEGEKNVAAVFSLARKLTPCVVFLDEADAIFASRDAMRERTSHRDMLNQFLKEWDGLNDMSVFVMVATNRPFDLDDAVIRRLPRRLLVDLPTQADRKEILRIHLTGEQLDESVDLEDLAKRTPFYSGSDLKNVAVSAALACVKEENEQAAIAAASATTDGGSPSPSSSTSEATNDSSESSSSSNSNSPMPSSTSTSPSSPHLVRGQSYVFPERRVLHSRHFDKAIQEISASISENMSSLSAIKKFDEQYGDRKGNKRRKDFGFGVLSERQESAARVRV